MTNFFRYKNKLKTKLTINKIAILTIFILFLPIIYSLKTLKH